MVRLVGVDLPRNKQIPYALTYIHGIGLTSAKKVIEIAEQMQPGFKDQPSLRTWKNAGGRGVGTFHIERLRLAASLLLGSSKILVVLFSFKYYLLIRIFF